MIIIKKIIEKSLLIFLVNLILIFFSIHQNVFLKEQIKNNPQNKLPQYYAKKQFIYLNPNDGQYLYDAGRYKEAIITWKNELKKGKPNAIIYNKLGIVYGALKKFDNAEKMFNNAIELEPESPISYYNLGILFYNQNKFKEAINILKKVTILSPSYDEAHYYIGLCLEKSGYFSLAIEEYKNELKINPYHKNSNTHIIQKFDWENMLDEKIGILQNNENQISDYAVIKQNYLDLVNEFYTIIDSNKKQFPDMPPYILIKIANLYRYKIIDLQKAINTYQNIIDNYINIDNSQLNYIVKEIDNCKQSKKIMDKATEILSKNPTEDIRAEQYFKIAEIFNRNNLGYNYSRNKYWQIYKLFPQKRWAVEALLKLKFLSENSIEKMEIDLKIIEEFPESDESKRIQTNFDANLMSLDYQQLDELYEKEKNGYIRSSILFAKALKNRTMNSLNYSDISTFNEEGIRYLEKIYNEYSFSPIGAVAIFHLFGHYTLNKNLPKSLELFILLKKEYPESYSTILKCELIPTASSALDKLIVKKLNIQSSDEQKKVISEIIKLDSSLFPSLINALKSENAIVRNNAVIALGEIKDINAVYPLIEALKDSESIIRSSAAKSLGEIGDNKAAAPLIGLLNDKNKDIRLNCIIALGKIKDSKSVEPLINALKDKNPSVQEKTVESLGMIKDPRAIDPLIKAFNGYYSNITKILDNFFESTFDFANESAYESIFIKSYTSVKKSTVIALGEFNDNRITETLINALKDVNEDKNIKILIIETLAKIRNKNTIELLINESKNEDKDIRISCIKALSKFNSPDFFRYYVDALDDKEIDVQIAAIEALGILKNKDGFIYLVNFLGHKNNNIKNAALSTLIKITDNDFGQDFESWMNWWDDELLKAKIFNDKNKQKKFIENNNIKFFLDNLEYFNEYEKKMRFLNFIIKWKNDYKKIMETQFVNMLEDNENGFEYALKFIALQEEYKQNIIALSYSKYKGEPLIEEPLHNFSINLENGKKIRIINYWYGPFCSIKKNCNSYLYFYNEKSYQKLVNQNQHKDFNFLVVANKFIQFYIFNEPIFSGNIKKEKWLYDISRNSMELILSFNESKWEYSKGSSFEMYSFTDYSTGEKLGEIITYHRTEYPLIANSEYSAISSPFFIMNKYYYDETKGINILAENKMIQDENFLEKAVMILSENNGLNGENTYKFDELMEIFSNFFNYNYKGANYLLDFYYKSNAVIQKAILLVFYSKLYGDNNWEIRKTIVDLKTIKKRIFNALHSSGYIIPPGANIINLSGRWGFTYFENNNEIFGQNFVFLQTGTNLIISDYPSNRIKLNGKIINDSAIINFTKCPYPGFENIKITGKIYNDIIVGKNWKFTKIE